MTIQQMKHIICIAKCGSISKAASELFLSQSSLSLSVKALESSLGVELFERTNRGIHLTSDGREYVERASEILSKINSLEDHFHNKPLMMRFSVSTQRLAFAIKAFSRYIREAALTGPDIAIRECHTYAVIMDIAGGRSDLGVIALSEINEAAVFRELDSRDIEFVELETMTPVAFMATTHPLAGNKAVSLDDLGQYAFVTYDQEVSISNFTEEPVFYSRFQRNIHVSDRSTKLALIRTGDCFSIELDLPNNASLKEASGKSIKWSRICAVPVSELELPFRIGYLIRKGYTPDPAGEQYVSFLRQEILALKKIRNQI